jgi:hypothetical protein
MGEDKRQDCDDRCYRSDDCSDPTLPRRLPLIRPSRSWVTHIFPPCCEERDRRAAHHADASRLLSRVTEDDPFTCRGGEALDSGELPTIARASMLQRANQLGVIQGRVTKSVTTPAAATDIRGHLRMMLCR